MLNIDFETLLRFMMRKGYKIWTGAYDLNVIGIRNPNRMADSFDDTLAIAYLDSLGNKRLELMPITTDPGLNYLKKPMNGKGCAIIAPGQYLGMWRIGMHQGKYRALVQVKPCTVYRDNNLDNQLDWDTAKAETGLFGINLHYVSSGTIARTVGNGSAGCQVLPAKEDHDRVLSLVDLQLRYVKSDAVSYTVLLESELKEFWRAECSK